MIAGLAGKDFRSNRLAVRTSESTFHRVFACLRAFSRLPRAGEEPDLELLSFPRLGKQVFWNSGFLPSVGKGSFWDSWRFPGWGRGFSGIFRLSDLPGGHFRLAVECVRLVLVVRFPVRWTARWVPI